MTHHEAQLKAFYQGTGLSFLGVSFRKAMQVPCIRTALECGVKSSRKGKPTPVQPALI